MRQKDNIAGLTQKSLPLSTLCLFIKENQILLAMKKRGFGKGKWNGVGGKVEQQNETILQAAFRESEEEIGLLPRKVEKCAIIDYIWPHKPDSGQQVHIFVVKAWEGELRESEEMRPQWFDITQIPYDYMWSDDIHWLPLVLEMKRIFGVFTFGEDEKIVSYSLKETPGLNS